MLASPAIATVRPDSAALVRLVRFEIGRALRNRRYLVFTLVFPSMIYLLYTQVLPAGGPGTLDGLTWPAYFMVSMAAYGAMGAAMGQAAAIAIERRGGWVRQLRTTPLPPEAYVVAKMASAVVLTAPALALVIAMATLVNHVDIGAGRALALVAALAIGSVPFAALAVLMGYLLDGESAQGGMMVAYFGMSILGGLFAPLESLPGALATIGRVLPASHLASLGRATASGQLPDPMDILVLGGWAVALASLAAWRFRRDGRQAAG